MAATLEYVPGLAGVPASRSKIGLIDGQKGELYYRGYPIDALAEHSSYEEVAYLLLKGSLPTRGELEAFIAELRAHRRLKFRIIELLKTLPESGHPMDALTASLSAVGMFYPHSMDTPEQRWGSAIRIMAKVPTIVAAFQRIRHGDEPIAPRHDLGHTANFLYMLTERVPSPELERLLDVCLVLHAEHGMNASTFAARVTGSTLSDPYAVISAAIATLAGPLHGGANEDVIALLRNIPGGVEAVRHWAEEQVAQKKKVPGFGHRVYKVKDPRAVILQRMAKKIFSKAGGGTPLYDMAIELEKVMEELVGAKGVYPNVDYYSGIVYERMGIPSDLFTPIFAIARTAGWLAHWLEQLENNRIFRPTQVYEGERGLVYIPIEHRK